MTVEITYLRVEYSNSYWFHGALKNRPVRVLVQWDDPSDGPLVTGYAAFGRVNFDESWGIDIEWDFTPPAEVVAEVEKRIYKGER